MSQEPHDVGTSRCTRALSISLYQPPGQYNHSVPGIASTYWYLLVKTGTVYWYLLIQKYTGTYLLVKTGTVYWYLLVPILVPTEIYWYVYVKFSIQLYNR